VDNTIGFPVLLFTLDKAINNAIEVVVHALTIKKTKYFYEKKKKTIACHTLLHQFGLNKITSNEDDIFFFVSSLSIILINTKINKHTRKYIQFMIYRLKTIIFIICYLFVFIQK
jgi:hypothetical protein